MEEQDITMGSASTAPSPITNLLSDNEQDIDSGPFTTPQQNGVTSNGRQDRPPSHGAEFASSGSGDSEDEEEEDSEDEGGEEEHERVDENGAIVIEDDDEDGQDDINDSRDQPISVKRERPSDFNSIAIPSLLNDAGTEQKPASKVVSEPADSDKPETPLPPPPSTASAKPKSKQKAKARSPSPIPIAPPPLQTIRLTIKLGGPDNYAVDISSLAKATGQRPATPVQKRHDDSTDSETEKTKPAESEEPKKKKKRKNVNSEYYDVADPFIDDSELALDDRKYFAQTKQQGFYVSSGEVALMKDRSPKKPKSKRVSSIKEAEAGPSSQHLRTSAEGTKDAPIALIDDESDHPRPPASQRTENSRSARKKKAPSETKSHSPPDVPQGTGLNAPLTGNLAALRKLNWSDSESNPADFESYGDGEEKLGMKRKRVSYSTITENGKKRKVIDITSFHPELQASLETLKEAIKSESWEQKGKFPPAIKPILAQVAIKAVTLDQYDEHFFNLMPTLFPYNKFTMSKLIKRTIFADHIKLLVERQDALLVELKRQADEGFSKAEEEWEKTVVAWDQRQKRLKADARGEDSASNGGQTRHPTEDPEAHADGLDEENHPVSTSHVEKAEKTGKGDKDKDAQPPAKKYRLTENMKAIVWELVLLSNECCRLENEKNTLEGSVMQVSEQGLRKVLYQKIVSAFPPGWMSSGQISRDVSAMKKRLEKEREEEQEVDNSATAP
ncbi:hypothetical protein D9757_003023 [Collybiopsis confluens]|uniref:Ubinuclein middle domain-containing protein n=1 Tax=Collybiopsis confluens TaxID=2823264 RepID=A0A8H5MEL7_9AGAR|nr:hypothetical protein D9757_003023 [Collybiopsis confluens]